MKTISHDEALKKKFFIEPGASIGEGVLIGSNSFVASDARIGPKSTIGDDCYIGHGSKLEVQGNDFSALSSRTKDFLVSSSSVNIGENAMIRSGSVIYRHVKIGRSLRTGHAILIREHTTIGDGCVVGTQAIIDGYVKVGDKSQVQSQCYVAQTVAIGHGVFIAPGCIFLDNKHILLGDGLRGAVIEDYVRIGGGCRILPSVRIGEGALIGAGSVVTRNIPEHVVAFGSPARVVRIQTSNELEKYRHSVENWE